MPDQHYQVGERVQVYLDSKYWGNEGWFNGSVIRIDPYSEYRNFIWVELDTSVMDTLGGMASIISVLNPKNIKKGE